MTYKIEDLPIERTWLDDIIDIFRHRPERTAEIDAIVLQLGRSRRNLRSNPEATVTRTINNYCVNANDSNKMPTAPLFERINKATYRLIEIDKFDLYKIQKKSFSNTSEGRVHREYFTEIMKKLNLNHSSIEESSLQKYCDVLNKNPKIVAQIENEIYQREDAMKSFGLIAKKLLE